MQEAELIGLRVEVSGWDAEGQFFIEHSSLGSAESGQKTLLLRHAVHKRSFVFVRALCTDSIARSHPEAHHVERIEAAERGGYNKLHLTGFPPRRTRAYEPKDPPKHPISVREEVTS